jgi:hypothetical protein
MAKTVKFTRIAYCTKGKHFKPTTDFVNRQGRSLCKACNAKISQAYRDSQPEKVQVADQNSNQLTSLQGIRDYVNAPGTHSLLNTGSSVVSGLLNGDPSLTYNPQAEIGQLGAGKLAGYVRDNTLGDPADGINRFMYQNTTDPSLNNNIQGALDAVTQNMSGVSAIQGVGNQLAQNAKALNENNAINSLFGVAYDDQQNNRLKAIMMGNGYQNNQASTIADLLNSGDQNRFNSLSTGLNHYDATLQNPLALLTAQGAAGDQQQAYDQAQLNDASNRYNFDQNAQWDNLMRYSNMISPVATMGKAVTNINTGAPAPKPNKAMGAAGGALSGAGMGSTFGPWGALAGGVIGAGAGYFSG